MATGDTTKKVGFWQKLRKSKSAKNLATPTTVSASNEDSVKREVASTDQPLEDAGTVDLIITHPSSSSLPSFSSQPTANTLPAEVATSLNMMFARSASTDGSLTYAFTPPIQPGELAGALNPTSLLQKGFISAIDVSRTAPGVSSDAVAPTIPGAAPPAGRLSWAEGCDSRLSYCNQRLQNLGAKLTVRGTKKIPGTPYPDAREFKWNGSSSDGESSSNNDSSVGTPYQSSPETASCVWTANEKSPSIGSPSLADDNAVKKTSSGESTVHDGTKISGRVEEKDSALNAEDSEHASQTPKTDLAACTVDLKPTGNFAMEVVQRLSQIAFGIA